MENTDSTPRFGQPSRLAHSQYSHSMALSGSQHPFAQPQLPLVDLLDEKPTSNTHLPSNHAVPYPASGLPQPSRPHHLSLASSYPATSIHHSRPAPASAYTRPRGLRIANLLKPWTPIILYAMTSFGFLAAIAFWKAEVFQGQSPNSYVPGGCAFTSNTAQAWTISRIG